MMRYDRFARSAVVQYGLANSMNESRGPRPAIGSPLFGSGSQIRPASSSALEQPGERLLCQRIAGVAAADVRVRADEPALFDALASMPKSSDAIGSDCAVLLRPGVDSMRLSSPSAVSPLM